MRRASLVLSTFLVAAGCGGQVSGGPATDEAALGQGDAPYLALGDSIAFGYNPDDAANDPTNPTAFVGYPEQLASDESAKESNASCEGETSASFYDVAAPDNGCHAWRAAGDYMHVQYQSNGESQLDFALRWLHTHPYPKLITLGIGANDLLLLQASCKNDPVCILPQLPGVLAKVAENVGIVLASLRGAGYFGQIVLVNYYATNYQDPLQLGAIPALNGAVDAVGAAFGAKVVPTFDIFLAASGGDPCGAGLLYKVQTQAGATLGGDTVGGCDKHPSAAGRALIARSIEAVASF